MLHSDWVLLFGEVILVAEAETGGSGGGKWFEMIELITEDPLPLGESIALGEGVKHFGF